MDRPSNEMRKVPAIDPTDAIGDGLTASEAAARLARGGPNALPTAGPRSTWAILLDVVREDRKSVV